MLLQLSHTLTPMLPRVNPTKTKAWKALEAHAAATANAAMRDLFAADPNRFERMHLHLEGLLLFDYAKHRVDEQTLSLLEQLFDQCGVSEGFKAQLAGDAINETENRAGRHTPRPDPARPKPCSSTATTCDP